MVVVGAGGRGFDFGVFCGEVRGEEEPDEQIFRRGVLLLERKQI